MSQSKPAVMPEGEMGIVRQAMAYRVKYRIGHAKMRKNIRFLGIHPKNRAGVYACGETVKALGVNLMKWAFSQEEADHAGVCVEEVPTGQRSSDLKAYTDWNQLKCEGNPLLKTCFIDCDVLFGTLSHSHLLLVLLCWLTAAKWDLVDESMKPWFCTPNGELD